MEEPSFPVTTMQEFHIPARDIQKGDLILYDREVRRMWLPIRDVVSGTDSGRILLELELPLSYLEGLDEFTLPMSKEMQVRSIILATQTLILWQLVPDSGQILIIERNQA
jgi:hypothetical protein